MRLVVTGGAGFIGSNYVKQVLSGLLPGVKRVTVLDKLTYAGTQTNLDNLPRGDFEFIKGDICDESVVEKLLDRHDAIVNFAAESHVDRSISGSRDFVLTNVLGTHTLLEGARRKGEIIFVQVSTDEVYGSINEKEADEFASLKPSSSYSASKASADLLALAAATTFKQKIIISRCCNNYGPGQNIEKFIPNMINSIINGNLLSIYGNGLNIREWINVKDHVNALWEILINGKIGEIYNIGTADRYTNLELALKILKIFKLTEEQISFVPDRKGHDYRYALNSKKIEKELNWRPNYHLDSDLRNLVKTYIGDN